MKVIQVALSGCELFEQSIYGLYLGYSFLVYVHIVQDNNYRLLKLYGKEL